MQTRWKPGNVQVAILVVGLVASLMLSPVSLAWGEHVPQPQYAAALATGTAECMTDPNTHAPQTDCASDLPALAPMCEAEICEAVSAPGSAAAASEYTTNCGWAIYSSSSHYTCSWDPSGYVMLKYPILWYCGTWCDSSWRTHGKLYTYSSIQDRTRATTWYVTWENGYANEGHTGCAEYVYSGSRVTYWEGGMSGYNTSCNTYGDPAGGWDSGIVYNYP